MHVHGSGVLGILLFRPNSPVEVHPPPVVGLRSVGPPIGSKGARQEINSTPSYFYM
jgi:hypothetical protein